MCNFFSNKILLPILGVLCCIFILQNGHAQGTVPEEKDSTKNQFEDYVGQNVSVDDQKDSNRTIAERGPEFFFEFKNLNKIRYYYDEKATKEILRLDKKQDYHALRIALEEYVLQFGIENFHNNTNLIWRLAQLYEYEGDDEKARYLYRLVLRHTHHEVKEIRNFYKLEEVKMHYDSINVLKKENWVPIDVYYELIDFRSSIDTLRPPVGVFLSMGDYVNSPLDDYGPTLTPDGNVLIFTSQRNFRVATDKADEDLFICHIDEWGYWSEAEPIPSLNSYYNEGSACLSKDQKTIYFTRCGSPDGYGNCDIYVSHFSEEDSTWEQPKNLGMNINSRSWDSQPSLSHTEDTLFYASSRMGGFGLSDIYMSIKDKEGKWGPGINLGPVINSNGHEASPFLHKDKNVLYFSSTGFPVNFGGYDIYKSRVFNGKWQEPKNVGPLVNGAADEYYFTIDSSSTNLYYSGALDAVKPGENRDQDLYSFPLPMGAQPDAYIRLHGELKDSATGEVYDEGIVSVIDLSTGIEVAPKDLRKDGSFDFDLIEGKDYLLIIQGKDFFRMEEELHLAGDTAVKFFTPHLVHTLQFTTLEFAPNSAEITDTMKADLLKVFNFMVDNPEYKLKISGHTDMDGDPKANIELSQKRADAIKEFICGSNLVSRDRILSIGYGGTRPIVKEELTEDDKKKNRRVEFKIIRPGDEDYEEF